MIASERSLYILRAIHERGVINLKEVAVELGTSEATIRRDLEKLERAGKLTRVQGGATSNGGGEETADMGELAMRSKMQINHAEKLAVAAEAAKNVQDGDTVFLDCGTSIAPLGAILLRRKVRIVTYSTLLLSQVKMPKAELVMLGGVYDPHHSIFTGTMAEQMLRSFRFEHAFIGCYGVSLAEGKCYDLDMASTNIKLIGAENAVHRYLLLDDSKLEKRGFYGFADLTAFDHVYCTRPAVPAELPENFVLVQK
ncbi:DeoR/GlpR family DNA-binding transcription regulator [Candidatus Allofournierella merdavium]|uniref:DeoR/GlpR family DNA-binding transcription regulator n=1 Tax=Candidatus Allofournierella merdavium TaxID=2838593 RepID=UPI00374F33BF